MGEARAARGCEEKQERRRCAYGRVGMEEVACDGGGTKRVARGEQPVAGPRLARGEERRECAWGRCHSEMLERRREERCGRKGLMRIQRAGWYDRRVLAGQTAG
uniref:Uncharacterized protein n=1 Tax=Oryza sativa subsp. japonica TaxID=39947 RepID=Q7EYI8_ORYSJ|nr:hypothetical protein [Oryza sativa Japonica Group]